MLYTRLLVATTIVGMVGALKCYQTDDKTGKNVLIDDDAFIYCVSFPWVNSSKKTRLGYKISTSGLKKEELDADFDVIFKQNLPAYSVLSLCISEKYDWPQLWQSSTKSGKKAPKVEYQFRCLCNTDLCNHLFEH